MIKTLLVKKISGSPTEFTNVVRLLDALKRKQEALSTLRAEERDHAYPFQRRIPIFHLVNIHRPAVFVFLETKTDELRARQVMLQLDFHDLKAIKANDKKGGVWILWKNVVDIVDFKEDFSLSYALFHFKNTNIEALVTSVHGPSTPKERHEMWHDMQSNIPPPNARQGATLIWGRLDRAIGNAAWLDQFPHTKDSSKTGKGKQPTSSSSFGWEAPKEGYFNINTDGSWMNSATSSGGGVIRRADGSCKYDAVNPFLVELYALNDGLSIADDLRLKKVIVETDAKTLRDMLLTTGPNPHHELATIICDVATVIAKFEVAIISHIPREKNELAHKLVVFGREMVVGYKTHYLVPECVRVVYEAEKAQVVAATQQN